MEILNINLLEKSPFKLLSKKQQEKTSENLEILEILSSHPKIYLENTEISNLYKKEELGRRFDLGTSPLTYEEKDYD